jgi:hypothetical protein
MTFRARLPLAGLVLAAGSLLLVTTAPSAAYSVTAGQAPSKPGKPDKPKPGNKGSKKPDKPRKVDRRAPAAPALGSASPGAGGSISLPVSAESGSRVVVRENGGGVVASGTGSGTYTWWTSTGSHSYVVTATDQAGNRSRASQLSATADATPPSLTGVQTAVGDRTDSRSRLTFVTDPGSSYRVLVDGTVVRQRTDPDARVALFLDVGNGRHRVAVEVRDPVGNLATWTGSFKVRIPRLRLSARMLGNPTEEVQRLRIEATPNATRGVVRVPGEGREKFRFFRGRATVRLALPDGTYDDIRVTVRDGSGRSGQHELRPFEVDTTPPEVTARLDSDAAADGVLRATVATDPGAAVAWRLLDAGDVVTTGDLVADGDGTAAIDRDVAEGDYRLVVSATDEFERTTSTVVGATVAPNPWSYAKQALVAGGIVGAGIVLVILTIPLVPFLVRLGRRARARMTVWQIERRVERSMPLFEEPEDDVVPPTPAVIPAQRSRHDAVEALLRMADAPVSGGSIFPLGVELLPDERILHSTTGQLFEAVDGDSDELVLDGHDGEVVVTNRRVVFVGDVTRDWWTGLIDGIDHVGDDRTVLRRWREDAWSGLVYDDADVTRLYVDMLVAEQQGNRGAYLSRLEEELHGESPVVGGRD